MILLSAAGTGLAQRPVRIKFAKGATSTIVSGRLNGYKSKPVEFVIRLKAGQSLWVESLRGRMDTHYVTVDIEDPSGEDPRDMDLSCHSDHNIENTKAGDYKISVSECRKADSWRGSFRLKIEVK